MPANLDDLVVRMLLCRIDQERARVHRDREAERQAAAKLDRALEYWAYLHRRNVRAAARAATERRIDPTVSHL